MNPTTNPNNYCKYCFVPLKLEEKEICNICKKTPYLKKAKPNCVCCGKEIYSAKGLAYRVKHNGNYCSACCNNAQRLWMLKAGIDCNKNAIDKLKKKLRVKGLKGYVITKLKNDVKKREDAIKEKSIDLDRLIKTLPQYFNGKLPPQSKQANSLVE